MLIGVSPGVPVFHDASATRRLPACEPWPTTPQKSNMVWKSAARRITHSQLKEETKLQFKRCTLDVEGSVGRFEIRSDPAKLATAREAA